MRNRLLARKKACPLPGGQKRLLEALRTLSKFKKGAQITFFLDIDYYLRFHDLVADLYIAEVYEQGLGLFVGEVINLKQSGYNFQLLMKQRGSTQDVELSVTAIIGHMRERKNMRL